MIIRHDVFAIETEDVCGHSHGSSWPIEHAFPRMQEMFPSEVVYRQTSMPRIYYVRERLDAEMNVIIILKNYEV